MWPGIRKFRRGILPLGSPRPSADPCYKPPFPRRVEALKPLDLRPPEPFVCKTFPRMLPRRPRPLQTVPKSLQEASKTLPNGFQDIPKSMLTPSCMQLLFRLRFVIVSLLLCVMFDEHSTYKNFHKPFIFTMFLSLGSLSLNLH
jgi:hypothetical protein